jgi:hypothetical protein
MFNYFPDSICDIDYKRKSFIGELTRRVSLVEQELLTLPEHEFTPVLVGFVLLDL